MRRLSAPVLRAVVDLAVLLLGTGTILFFLLHLTGDPALVLAGPDATPVQLHAVRADLGLDRSLLLQYLDYLGRLAKLDLGRSLSDGTPSAVKAARALPASLVLGVAAMTLAILVSVPLGLWLGATRSRTASAARGLLFVIQGFPAFVIALLLVQLFAIQLTWLPALGASGPASLVLPAISVACFLSPKLARLIEANTAAAMPLAYVRTARATGASDRAILWRHVAPNALLGAIALIGAQFAFLVTGLVIIETIFAWPGIGWLLVQSTTNLDFPTIQAITFFVVIGVFAVNLVGDLAQTALDPRLRTMA